MADLRRPHERRSDQLSVLVRRPLSVANFVPRFLRTTDIASTPQNFRFDDYDSDQETDATSDILRIRRSSSASALSIVSVPSDPPRRLTPPLSHPDSRKPPAIIIDSAPIGHFTRSRAKSFYGAAADVALDKEHTDSDEENAENENFDDGFLTAEEIYSKNKVSEQSLRGALGEDYELFLPRQPASAPEFPSSQLIEPPKLCMEPKILPPSPEPELSSEEPSNSNLGTSSPCGLTKECSRSSSLRRLSSGLSISSVSPEPDDDDEIDEDGELSLARRRAATSPILGRPDMDSPIDYVDSEQTTDANETKRGGNLVRRLVSATSPRAALGGTIRPRRSTQRRSRSNADPTDPELTARADELRNLIADSRAAKGCTEKGVPLFVEEAGRAPRVAFVNGDLKRVRVRRASLEGGTTTTPPPKTQRSSMRFGVAGAYRKRRPSSGTRRRNGGGRGFAFGFVRRLQEVDRKMHSRRNRKMRSGRKRFGSNDIITAAHSGALHPRDESIDHAAARPIDSSSTSTTKRNYLRSNLLGKWKNR